MAFRRAMQRTLKDNNAGITFEMLQVLSSLWHEQGITQQALAERTAKDKACLTNLMNNLEKKGYVYRKEDTNDRRNKLVYLTPEGEALKVQIRPILNLVYANAEEILSTERQQDSLFLSVEQLFESGIKSSLQLQSDSLKERMAHERKLYAKTGLLPDLEIGLKGGIIGQPVVFQNGLSNPTYPDTPDWSQNYTVDFNQPLYQGGKIRRSIQKADIETEIARLQRMTNQADIKLGLLNQYLTLFTLFKQHLVLTRNIEESERRLQDIRQMKKEGLITNK